MVSGVAMSNFTENDDLEGFAHFVGLKGTDTDLFYEMYYELNSDAWEEEFIEEEEIPKSYKS